MRGSLFASGDWPLAWPGGSSRIVESRPLAVDWELAPWHSGLPFADLTAYREAGQLPVIELGPVTLVMIRDLDNLLSQLARGEKPHPERPSRSRRKRSNVAEECGNGPRSSAEAA